MPPSTRGDPGSRCGSSPAAVSSGFWRARARSPFAGATIADVFAAIVHRQPDLSELERIAGAETTCIVRRCLAKSPADRWRSAEELLAALRPQPVVRTAPRALSLVRRSQAEPVEAWDGRSAVRTEGLTKRYGFRAPVLQGVDLDVPRGSIYALLGRNGCGKSTLLRILIGLYRRDAGTVRVLGRDPEREGPHLNGRIGFVPEVPTFDDGARVAELLDLASRLWPRWERPYANRLVERYGLDPGRRVRELSRGDKSKLSFVLAIGHRPELLVLDDPTLGLDAVVLDEVLETLEELSRTEASTVLIGAAADGPTAPRSLRP